MPRSSLTSDEKSVCEVNKTSPASGHLAPMVGKDWNHAGVAQLYNNIKENGYQLMFLSSRAISQSKVGSFARVEMQKVVFDPVRLRKACGFK